MKPRLAWIPLVAAGLAACATHPPTIPPVASVDLPRFMGDWYVIAHIPSRPEREAYDAVESYRLGEDGRIRTTFRYRKGGFDAPPETMEPVGTVVPGTHNAVWGMQFVWPVKAEYVIVDLAPDYSRTIIGRSKRDYVWLMARTPSLPESELESAIARIGALGYDTTKLRMVPQSAAASR
ncbi:lipocalin family protein [Pseudoluteimonas lycopersici]|uniref:Outer membrane lipoprotein Blc n=1 Tax=Pseudoluteimonas lycopersici TaxID=1324796 RepID=A0A516V3S5_9GAMM|nr:lipocalin family protein [Lysobacter lycopersici]QDQ73181.1 lipocalin family protein [Lysobacter lycopersici]